VLVHSSFKSFGGVEGGPRTIVQALVYSLGTVMMPTFTSARTGVWDPAGAFRQRLPSQRPADWHEPSVHV
jgi:aminoglycoside N3'-acetyltransferase